MLEIITQHQREQGIKITRCTRCSSPGASQWCSRCKAAYYCNRDCQVSHWKVHKKVCGRDSGEKFVDIVVSKMVDNVYSADIGRTEGMEFINSMTGARSKSWMKPKADGKPVVVKITVGEHEAIAVKINQRNSDFLLVQNKAGGASIAHKTLRAFVAAQDITPGKAYAVARWIAPEGQPLTKSDVLRVDISVHRPVPRPIW